MAACITTNLLTEEKQKCMELAYNLKKAIGHRTISEFAKDCRMTDITILVAIIKKELTEFPSRRILRTIADGSEGRVTYRSLYDICGYSENDPEEDLSYVYFKPQRGDVYYVDLGWNIDAEQNGIRPCVVVQNNLGNDKAPTVVVCPITSRFKKVLPTHVKLTQFDGMKDESIVLTEQIKCISKRRFFYNGCPWRVNRLTERKMVEVNNAIEIELGLDGIMFNEERAFELLRHIKALEENVKLKKSFDLSEILENKIDEIKRYCSKYKKNHEFIREEYERVHLIRCAI